MNQLQWKEWHRQERLAKKEVWKPIIGYEGLYEVSSMGMVRSLYSNTIMKPILQLSGYVHIALYKNKVMSQKRIHRLVAEAFIPNTETKPQVNHINAIKIDNRTMNLEWCTSSENCQHASDVGLNPNKGKYGILNHQSKMIGQYSKEGILLKVWGGQHEASRALRINRGNIGSCCRGMYPYAGGFVWKFII